MKKFRMCVVDFSGNSGKKCLSYLQIGFMTFSYFKLDYVYVRHTVPLIYIICTYDNNFVVYFDKFFFFVWKNDLTSHSCQVMIIMHQYVFVRYFEIRKFWYILNMKNIFLSCHNF